MSPVQTVSCAILPRLRAVIEAKEAETLTLRAEPEVERELRRLELRLAKLERRLRMDSSDSGTPSSKERIEAKEKRRDGSPRSGSVRNHGEPDGQPRSSRKRAVGGPDPGGR
jgi:transposase